MKGFSPSQSSLRKSFGFTLVEAVIVMVITGIIAAVVAIFIQRPVEGYFDTVRRAQLSDTADLALRRIAREVQTALPNSIRATISGNSEFLEFLPVRSGGRYCASSDCGNALDFTSSDGSFSILGPSIAVEAGDGIVIYNTGQAGADAYEAIGATSNRRVFNGTAGTTLSTINFNVGPGQFPRGSPSNIFQVISTPITYACDASTGTLWRYAGYTIQATQPNAFSGNLLSLASGTASGVRLATNVVCATTGANLGTGFVVRPADGLLALRIHLRDDGEVRLLREVHVDNVP